MKDTEPSDERATQFDDLSSTRGTHANTLSTVELRLKKGLKFPSGFNSTMSSLILDRVALPYSGIRSLTICSFHSLV